MASIKPTPMEVITLLDSEDEEEGRNGVAARGKSGKMIQGTTSMKPPPPKATRNRRLIKAHDSDDDDDDSDAGGGNNKEEVTLLPTSRVASARAGRDGGRRGGGATSPSSSPAHHHDDVVEDSDSECEAEGVRRGRKPGLKRGTGTTGPPSSTIVTKKPRKTGGQKDGGPSSSILQFMKKAPAGAASSSSSMGNGTSGMNGAGIRRKRPASQLLQPPPPPKISQELWIDKHRPKKATDLSIPPQKVKQVRQWLTTALEQGTNKLLILRGPPGVGKSTMAEVLAEEMGLDVLGWTEAAGVQAWRGEVDEEATLSMSSHRGEFSIPYVSQADDFGTFLRGAAYQPLVVTTSPAKKSLYQLSQEASSTRGRGRLFLIQELPSQVDHTSHTSSTYTQRALATFQASLQAFLLQSVHPAILIYTECESSGGEALLERILSRSILQDPRIQQIQIRPTTDLKLRKVLERVAGDEGVRFNDSHEVEDLVSSCNGDVRHAIMKLQFQYGHRRKVLFSSSQRPSSSSQSSQSQADGGGGEVTARAQRSKDRFYSSLHAVGKVLNAKRDSSLPGRGDGRGRGPLNFDPEEALLRCEMEIDGLAVFLQTHCVPFFSQIDELVGAMDHFSDADLFVSRLYSASHMRDRSDPIFPEEYALSISSRGVADTNIHPAPPAFRTFPTPRYWEVNRRRTDGVRRLSYLSNLYAQNAVGDEVGPGRMPSTTMVTEFIPFVKSIGEKRHRGTKPASGSGDGEEEDPSLLGALEFLRLFNQTCCASGSADAYRSLRDTQRQLLASSTAQEVMEVDDIVDD